MSDQQQSLSILRRGFNATSRDDAPTADCPPPAVIWEGVRDQLASAEQRWLIEHIAGCPSCTEAWRLAVEIDDDAGRRRSSAGGWWKPLLAVAALLPLALGLSILDRTPAPEVLRAPADGLELLGGPTVPRQGWVIRWQGAEEAEFFALEIGPEAQLMTTTIEEPYLTDREYGVLPQDLEGLPAGTELAIFLTAYRQDGNRLASRTFIRTLE